MTSAGQQPAQRSDLAERSPEPEHVRVGLGAYVGTFASSLFIQGCSLFQGVIVARLLGPAARGQYAAAILWPTWFANIGILGIDAALARRAGARGDLGALARTSLVMASVTATISMAVAWLFIPFVLPARQPELVSLAYLALPLIPLMQFSLGLQAITQGAGRFGVLNLSRSVFYPVYLGSLIAIWLLRLSSVRLVVMAFLAGNATVLAVILVARWRDLARGLGLVEPRNVVAEGLRFSVATLGSVVHQRIDQALLVWLLPMQDLGFYVVALSAASVVSSAATSISMVCFTHAAQAKAHEGFSLIARDFRRASIVCLAAGLALAPALPLLLPFFYGEVFARSSRIGSILILGSILAGLGQILDQALRGQNRPFAGLTGRIVAIGVGFAAGYGLTAALGLTGMALAYCASQLTYVLVLGSSAIRHYRGASVRLLVPARGDVRDLASTLRRVGSRLIGTNRRA